MKQLLFMIAAELIGTLGVFVGGPFTAVAVYYLFAVLRPQFLWQWVLPPDIPWSQIPAIAAILGTFAYILGFIPIRGRRERPFPGFSGTHVAFVAFGVWLGLTYVTAVNQGAAWPWLIEYVKIFVMFLVAAIVVRTFEQAWSLYLVATFSLLYIAYHVNSLYFFDGRLDIYHVGYGGLDNNGAGLMIAMGIPLALSAFEATRKIWRWLFVATIPLMIHAVLVTYSRGAMVSVLAVVPLLILRSRRRWQFLAVLVLLASTVPYLAGREIRDRFFSVSQYQEDQSADSRFNSWQAAIEIANDHPIVGVGIRNANLLSYRYGADMQGRTIHSQFLQILADEGYPGLALYLLGIASFFVGLYRARRKLRGRFDDNAKRAVAMMNGLEGSLVVFCVGGVFLSLEVFELPYLVILLGAQLAVLVRSSAPVSRTVEGEVTASNLSVAYAAPATR